MKGLLQIGEFARLGGVSVKALRFYDEQGLLRPEHVDPQTGYRYYTLDQAGVLAVITNLRLADFTISEIAALLGRGRLDPERLRRAAAAKKSELLRARERLETKLRIVGVLAQSGIDATKDDPPFRLTPVADQRVYAIRRTVPQLGEPVKDMFETAEAAVAEHDARAPSAPFLIFHDPPATEKNLAVEVCIPVDGPARAALPVTVVEGCDIACATVYAGGYFKTDILFDRMTEWMRGAGLNPGGPLREIYHRFGADQEDYRLPAKMTAKNQRGFLTELQIPVSLP